jgi:hypothetical protein
MLPSPSDRLLLRLAAATGVPMHEFFEKAGRALPPWAKDNPFENVAHDELPGIIAGQVGVAKDEVFVAGMVERLSKLPPARRKRVIDFLQDLFAEDEADA